MIPWWAPVAPAEHVRPCGSEVHPVVWRDGALALPAHDDLEAERTLVALGGAVPPCIHLGAVWAAWSDDPALVTLGRRPGEDGLGLAPSGAPATGSALHTSPPRRRRAGPDDRRDSLALLFSLPAPFIDRLVLTSMAAAAQRWADATFRRHHGLRLAAALLARARPALTRAAAALATPGEDLLVHAAPSPPGSPAELRAERTPRGMEVSAGLPLGWLSTVWGTGMSEPGGRLVVGLRAERNDGYEVDVVEWVAEGSGRWQGIARPALLERGATGAWSVRDGPR